MPAIRIGGQLVTTVLDLALAQYGVGREGLPGDWPTGYDDAERPCTPAWQEQITGVDRHLAARVAREFARNAEVTEGRSMICMGAGTNHWFHSDQVYRTFLALVMMCGCEGRNGGGWAHYVGQEKVRPLTGWQTVAFALDWVRPPRHQSGTPFFYVATGQWRYERIQPEHLASPLGRGLLAGRHILDVNALGSRLGWLPSYPSFDRSTLELVDEAEREGIAPAEYVVRELREGRLRFACEDPDAPQNYPRVMTVWRSNLLGSSGKGHEYFLKHLLGVPDSAVRAEETPPELRPREVVWRDQAPEGKLDLLTTIDFRMTSNALFSDVVLPAATWYEKYDLSSTDLHPFVHAFNEAIAPPWEAKSDWDAFHRIAIEFSRLAERHLGSRRDLVAAPLLHDTPDEIAQPLGEVRDWKAGECEPVPGRTMPKLLVLERDYPNVGERWAALGPLLEELGSQTKGAAWKPIEEVAELRAKNGAVRGGVADGRPSLERVEQACEAILALSGTTNGRLAVEGFRSMEARTGVPLADLAQSRAGDRITFADAQVQPRTVITSPEWSGIEAHGRRYAPFTTNTEREKPWHTLSGRQHFYLDHAWMLELGRGAAGVPPAASSPRDLRRPGRPGRLGTGGADAQVPDAALEVVDPLRVPGQHPHADAVPRRRDAVGQPRGRRGPRDQGQRLGRGVQPQRRRRVPRNGLAPHPAGHVPDVPRQGPPPERAADRAAGQARRDGQLADADRDEADALHRRLRAAELRL